MLRVFIARIACQKDEFTIEVLHLIVSWLHSQLAENCLSDMDIFKVCMHCIFFECYLTKFYLIISPLLSGVQASEFCFYFVGAFTNRGVTTFHFYKILFIALSLFRFFLNLQVLLLKVGIYGLLVKALGRCCEVATLDRKNVPDDTFKNKITMGIISWTLPIVKSLCIIFHSQMLANNASLFHEWVYLIILVMHYCKHYFYSFSAYSYFTGYTGKIMKI